MKCGDIVGSNVGWREGRGGGGKTCANPGIISSGFSMKQV